MFILTIITLRRLNKRITSRNQLNQSFYTNARNDDMCSQAAFYRDCKPRCKVNLFWLLSCLLCLTFIVLLINFMAVRLF